MNSRESVGYHKSYHRASQNGNVHDINDLRYHKHYNNISVAYKYCDRILSIFLTGENMHLTTINTPCMCSMHVFR